MTIRIRLARVCQPMMTVMMIFFQNNEWPIPENTVIPRKAADNVNRTVRNRNNNRAQCSAPENENDTTSDENSGPVDQPFTKLTTAGAGIEIGQSHCGLCKM